MAEKSIAEQIAIACGLTVHARFEGLVYVESDRLPGAFDPERDANAAVLAAEKFGLFKKHILMLGAGEYWIAEMKQLGCEFGVMDKDTLQACGNTFCKAIVNAILHLSRKGE